MLNKFSFLEFFDKYFLILKFLSIWVWILVILHQYTSNVFNLIFLTLFVCVGGSFISFVYPKYYSFSFGSINTKIKSLWKRLVIEIIFHLLLLIYVITLYKDKYSLFSYQTLNSVLLLIIYCIIIDVYEMYHLQQKDILIICMIFVVILFLLSKII
jgi:hypothetical protein